MPSPRNRTQLAIQISPDLMEQLRAAASAQRRTVTAVVQEALEVALSGFPAARPGAAGIDLLARLEALEAAVAELQRQRLSGAMESAALPMDDAPSTDPSSACSWPGEGADRPTRPIVSVPEGGIPSTELADRLGIKRETLNAQISREGGAVEGLELHGWRCCGKRSRGRGGLQPHWVQIT